LGFRQMPLILHHDMVLDNVSREVVNGDIFTFFRQEFSEIRDIFEDIDPSWPGEERLALLVQNSAGLFIYAVTVCWFIENNEQCAPEDLICTFTISYPTKESQRLK